MASDEPDYGEVKQATESICRKWRDHNMSSVYNLAVMYGMRLQGRLGLKAVEII